MQDHHDLRTFLAGCAGIFALILLLTVGTFWFVQVWYGPGAQAALSESTPR